MSDTEPLDQEPPASEIDTRSVSLKPRRSISKLRRELDEVELSNPAALRFLLDEIDRLDRAVTELEGYRERFHEVDKQKAVLEQKSKESRSADITFGVCLCVGAALLGYAPYLWNHQPSGIILIVAGVILILCGIFAKWKQK